MFVLVRKLLSLDFAVSPGFGTDSRSVPSFFPFRRDLRGSDLSIVLWLFIRTRPRPFFTSPFFEVPSYHLPTNSKGLCVRVPFLSLILLPHP